MLKIKGDIDQPDFEKRWPPFCQICIVFTYEVRETQLRMGGNSNSIIWQWKGWPCERQEREITNKKLILTLVLLNCLFMFFIHLMLKLAISSFKWRKKLTYLSVCMRNWHHKIKLHNLITSISHKVCYNNYRNVQYISQWNGKGGSPTSQRGQHINQHCFNVCMQFARKHPLEMSFWSKSC